MIGLIIIYFLGLFYLLDFNNRSNRDTFSEQPIFSQLPTLREKVEYVRRNMKSLKLRSEIMLWLGTFIGVAGLFAFIFTLKTSIKDINSVEFGAPFTVFVLRTFAIFSFMEIFCFYFLKQYRITFNEYKRFLSLHLRLMNYYQCIELTHTHSSAEYKDIREAILNECITMHDDPNLEKINEFERTVAADIVKTLSNKIPNAS